MRFVWMILLAFSAAGKVNGHTTGVEKSTVPCVRNPQVSMRLPWPVDHCSLSSQGIARSIG
jgi:hypothetical protein